MNPQNSQKYQVLFLDSSKKYMQIYVTNLQKFTAHQNDLASLNEMYIAIHSVKSQSQVMGHTKLSIFSQDAEKFLRALRETPRTLQVKELTYLQSVPQIVEQELATIAASVGNTQTETSRPNTTPTMATNNKRILLIDDDHFFKQFYSHKLRESGFTVTIASNGEEGLEKMKTDVPNLILLDLIMPLKDGFDVLKEKATITANNVNKIPVIIFSTLGQEKDIKTALALGANDYVNKGYFEFDSLLKKLTMYLH